MFLEVDAQHIAQGGDAQLDHLLPAALGIVLVLQLLLQVIQRLLLGSESEDLRVELVEQIVAECAPGYDKFSYTKNNPYVSRPELDSLQALARVCHATSEPALDVIWYYQYGIYNIIQSINASINYYGEKSP